MNKSGEKNFKGKNIAFFEPHRDFATNPVLVALTERLIELGATVDIFSPNAKEYPKITLKVTHYPFPYRLIHLYEGIKRTPHNIISYLENKSWRVHSLLKTKRYNFVFGIDSEGLIAAYDYSKQHHIPFVYISFEIFFHDELKSKFELKEKEREIIASRKSEFVIIPDKWRTDLLAKENKLAVNKFLYLPVAPRNTKIQDSNYLRNKYDIPTGKIIVLHSGSFENWTYAKELIESVPHWPENVVLIIHTRHTSKKNIYIKKLNRYKYKNVILSTTPLEEDKYEEMVSSADIGLCLYKEIPGDKNLQKNIKTIGLSSGKFSQYLKYGIPVISLNQITYSILLQKYKFGINLKSFSNIKKAISEITANYDNYKENARTLYTEKLDFDVYWPALLNKLISF